MSSSVKAQNQSGFGISKLRNNQSLWAILSSETASLCSEISVFVGIAKLRNNLAFAVLSSEMMYLLGSAKPLRDDLSLCHKHSVFVGTSKLRNNLILGQF